MKVFNTTILMIASFLATCSFQSGWAMDQEADSVSALIARGNGHLEFPQEVLEAVFRCINPTTYPAFVQCVQLRFVCKLWQAILTTEFIKTNLVADLSPMSKNDYRQNLRLLISQPQEIDKNNAFVEFSYMRKYRPHPAYEKEFFDNEILTIFDQELGKEQVQQLTRLFTLFRQNPNNAIVLPNDDAANQSPATKSLFTLWFEANDAGDEYRRDILKLLISQGLDVANPTALDIIARQYANNQEPSAFVDLQTVPDVYIDCKYLFGKICELAHHIDYIDLLHVGTDKKDGVLIEKCLQTMSYADLLIIAASNANARMLKRVLLNLVLVHKNGWSDDDHTKLKKLICAACKQRENGQESISGYPVTTAAKIICTQCITELKDCLAERDLLPKENIKSLLPETVGNGINSEECDQYITLALQTINSLNT